MRVTFDTNVLDLACRPERFPKDPRQPGLVRVRQALEAGEIHGFYPVTMLTIEGIQNPDRAGVYGGTKTVITESPPVITPSNDLPAKLRAEIGDGNLETYNVTLTVTQDDRKSLHPEVAKRVAAAKALGVRALRAVPRIGAFDITDETGEYYLAIPDDDLGRWIDAAHAACRAIEARGVGFAQVKALGERLPINSPHDLWFRALKEAKDIHEENGVKRAFSEWADGDALGSHIAYGIDVFCSADVGNSNARNSVLDPINRAWLTETYGVRFMTFDDLLAVLT